MAQVLATFGIDWRLLLVNAVNFGLVLLVLWYFLYGPVMRMLEERRKKVAAGVAAAQAALDRLQEIEASRAAKLAAAGFEADELIAEARAAGAAKHSEIVAEAQAQAATALREAEAQAQDLKAQALAESKQEVAKLIVLGIEKMT